MLLGTVRMELSLVMTSRTIRIRYTPMFHGVQDLVLPLSAAQCHFKLALQSSNKDSARLCPHPHAPHLLQWPISSVLLMA